MNFSRTWAITRKEFLHILRDLRSLIMALALPLVMLLLFGYALALDVDRVPTIIYDAARSPESRELIQRFAGSRYFRVIAFADKYQTIEEAIDRGQCLLGVVIPRDYSKRLLSGEEAEVQLLLDGSDSNTASIALGYVNALIQTSSQEIQAKALNRKGQGLLTPPVEARVRVWYNTDLKSRNFIVPGLIAVVMMVIASLLTSLTIAREWEMGTMEQLLSTPLRPAEFILGKMIPYFCIGLLDMLIAVMVGTLIFGVPLRGNTLLLLATACVFLFGALSWGLFLSSLARSQRLAYQLGMLTSFLPAFLLSGFIYAIGNMPKVIQVITYLIPTRYFVTMLKGIFLKGVGVEVLWLEGGMLILYSGLILFLMMRTFKRKVA
ncbi:MAG: ABC transporter permease [candidate division NC10 bacterium]|nr:ABC transporter permease [candidate division NC10 bacterium]